MIIMLWKHYVRRISGLFVDGVVNAFDLERLLDTEIEVHHEEALLVPSAVNKVADAFPALGIVACVLGIIITMAHLDGPPSEIGHHVGSALSWNNAWNFVVIRIRRSTRNSNGAYCKGTNRGL